MHISKFTSFIFFNKKVHCPFIFFACIFNLNLLSLEQSSRWHDFALWLFLALLHLGPNHGRLFRVTHVSLFDPLKVGIKHDAAFTNNDCISEVTFSTDIFVFVISNELMMSFTCCWLIFSTNISFQLSSQNGCELLDALVLSLILKVLMHFSEKRGSVS
jgi:hypothetical protein